LTCPNPCPPSSGSRCAAHRPRSRTCSCTGASARISWSHSSSWLRVSSGQTSSRTTSRIQSRCSWNSGSVEKSHAIVRLLSVSGRARSLRPELLDHLVDPLGEDVLDERRHLLLAPQLRIRIAAAADLRDVLLRALEDPERDHLVLVLDAARVIDRHRALRDVHPLRLPRAAELLPRARLQIAVAEEHQHAPSPSRAGPTPAPSIAGIG